MLKKEIDNMFKVFKRDIALKLRDRGFEIMDAYSNKKNPNYTVFCFIDSKELREAFEKINREGK